MGRSIAVQNSPFTIHADDKGHGGASHYYTVPEIGAKIAFQNGPVKEVGRNGIDEMTLIAILIDRLRCFQDGPFACDDNRFALTALRHARMNLIARTKDRKERGVEGYNKA